MARKRIVKTYSDTRAPGERTKIEGNRYFVRLDLVSVKIEKEADLIGRTTEIYFRAGGKGIFKVDTRTPDQGTINLLPKEVFTPKDRITLYSAFIDKKGGGVIQIPLDVFDRDLGKDQKLINTEISVTLGQTMEYFSFLEGGVKIKVGAAANQTRY